MIYYDGYLYMTQAILDFQTGKTSGNDIIRINFDGSNRTSLIHSDDEYYMIMIHQEYIYYVTSSGLYRLAINYDSSPEELFSNQLFSIGSQAFCKDEFMYLSVGVYEDKDNSKTYYGAFLEINLNTFAVQVIKENQPDLYFTYIKDGLFAYTNNNDTFLYDKLTGESTYLCDEAGQVHVTDNYIFVYNGPTKLMHSDGERTLVVFDKNFNRLDSIELDDGFKHWESGAYNNQLFFFYNDPNEYFSLERIYIMKVVNGKIKPIIFSEKKPKDNHIAGYQWNINDYK
jgi:hypothetical protein